MLHLLNTFRNFVSLMLIGVLVTPTAMAADRSVAGNPHFGYQDLEKLTRLFVGPPASTIRETLRNELLNTDDPNLKMPDYPRTWIQIQDTDWNETVNTYSLNLSLKTNVPFIPNMELVSLGGTKSWAIKSKYSVTTTFVAVSRLQTAEKLPENYVTPTEAKDPEILSTIHRLDYNEAKNYFLANESNPMVGFCIFETSMTMGNSTDGSSKVTFLGRASSEESMRKGSEKTVTQAAYSRFFQLKNNVPESHYVNTVCGKYFKEMVQPYVEADFKKLVYEYSALLSPDNDCVLTEKSVDEGDESCSAWYLSTVKDMARKKSTVARCVPNKQRKGWGRCELFSKEGMSCPLWNNQDGSYSERPVKRYYQNATLNGLGNYCDPRAEMKCELMEKPFNGWLFLYPKTARCVKK